MARRRQTLPSRPLSEEVVHDYETIRLSLKAHPVSFLRERLTAARGHAGQPRSRTRRDGAARRGGRRGARAPAARLRQGRGVHDAGGRDRRRQRHRLAKGVRRLPAQWSWARAWSIVRGRIQHAPDGDGYVTHLVARDDRGPHRGSGCCCPAPPLKPPRSHGDGASSASAEFQGPRGARARAPSPPARRPCPAPLARLPLTPPHTRAPCDGQPACARAPTGVSRRTENAGTLPPDGAAPPNARRAATRRPSQARAHSV